MTMDDNRILVDTNIFVYASVPSAPQRQPANDALQQLRNTGMDIIVSQQILREYIAVIVRLQNAGSGLPTATILENVAVLRTECLVVDDTPAVLDTLFDLLQRVPGADRRIYDANIVATMLVHGVRRLLTHNTKDFARYADVITVVPLEPPTPAPAAEV